MAEGSVQFGKQIVGVVMESAPFANQYGSGVSAMVFYGQRENADIRAWVDKDGKMPEIGHVIAKLKTGDTVRVFVEEYVKNGNLKTVPLSIEVIKA